MDEALKRVTFKPGVGFKVGDKFCASVPRRDLWSRILAWFGYVRREKVLYVCTAVSRK